MEVTGKLHFKGETKTFGTSFNKREFVLYIENERNADWSDHIKLELTQDRCSLIDMMSVGDEIRASINLKGRLWTNPQGEEVCFNTIEAWKLEKLTGTVQQSAPPNFEEQPPAGENEDLPF